MFYVHIRPCSSFVEYEDHSYFSPSPSYRMAGSVLRPVCLVSLYICVSDTSQCSQSREGWGEVDLLLLILLWNGWNIGKMGQRHTHRLTHRVKY